MSPARPATGRLDRRLRVLLAAVLLPGAALAQDADGDAIPDGVENQSWYLNAGGSPQRADVWVECDYMPGTVKKRGKIVTRTEAMFERAPFPGGIALHLAFDETIPFEAQWGDLQTLEGFFDTYEKLLDTRASRFDGHPFAGGDAATMREYIHYCVFVESMDSEAAILGISLDSTTTFGGIPGDMFLVALGQTQGEFTGRFQRQLESGVLLHELGHNLGLTHGGAAPRPHANFKPHYLSVMNYNYIPGFVRLTSPTSAEYFAYWDYARFTTGPLNEKRLDEEVGVAAPPEDVVTQDAAADTLLGLAFCPDESLAAFFWNNTSRDWDCDETIDTARVKVDLTLDEKKTKLGRGQVNWDHLVFDGGAIAGPGAARRSIFLEPLSEPALPTLRRLIDALPRARLSAAERPEIP